MKTDDLIEAMRYEMAARADAELDAMMFEALGGPAEPMDSVIVRRRDARGRIVYDMRQFPSVTGTPTLSYEDQTERPTWHWPKWSSRYAFPFKDGTVARLFDLSGA